MYVKAIFFSMNPVPVPFIVKCSEVFGVIEGTSFHRQLVISDFRSASTLREQIEFLQNVCPNLHVRQLLNLLGISSRAYYKAIKNDALSNSTVTKAPRRNLLLQEEEMEIINTIRQKQRQNDCLTGKDIRDIAADIYKRRTHEDRSFSRDWLSDFRQRYSEVIIRVKCESLDESRSNLSIEAVESYISTIEEVMKSPPHPLLLLNFDETGFGRRPDKGKRKYVYTHKECNIKPFWREISDIHHVSMVVCISAACTHLKPLLLSTRKTIDPDLVNSFFFRWGNYFQTNKGYMTTESMLYWIENILKPYITAVRSQIGLNQPCYIIADGCTSHFHQTVSEKFAEIGNICIIPLPPHSSHLSQMLDASFFASVKKKYSVLPNDHSVESKFTKKLLKIKRAFQSVANEELIRSSWEATGFCLNVVNGDVVSYEFSETFKSLLRAKATFQEVSE
ncbi:hypothetical protein TRFO_22767 [Tritrichomonas foetus]|uniref:HTH CENPB-type domain-containing protein n=1 Tax=Tritrichomonas foetus TaxID=1144522 RepID=A0A1J4KBS2_9EUKA|nr:hypothetical protein TRFO_22767 [Tritrichomonas foetus]|eukprot:OHT08675.1 hypothetical protein TRFO_22767 [Tritrichomonas foetus]